jgi:DHA1 family tetracycline resistance protein-like MFS transporter
MTAAAVAFLGTAFLDGSSVPWLYFYLIVGALSGLAAPAINSGLSREVADNMQGELQGAVNAANSLATIIGPLAATQIFGYFTYAEDSPGYFPGAPFIAAGIVIAASVILYLYIVVRFDLRNRKSVAEHPVVPEMAPPGQINIPTREEDDGHAANGNGNGHPPHN